MFFPRLNGLQKGLLFFALSIGICCSLMLLMAMPKKQPVKLSSAFVFVDIDNGSGHGSATHIGNGVFLTAGHVTKDANVLNIRTNDGDTLPAKVLWQNNEYDVALIYVKDYQKIASVPLSCAPNFVGQDITITGNPLGARNAKSWGHVSGTDLTGLEDKYEGMWKKLITLDISAAPGVSGAGVIDSSGKLVGILVAGMVSDRGTFPYTFAVPASVACHLLARS